MDSALLWTVLVLGVLIAIWLALSIRVVGPTETGIVVRLGEPKKVILSGIHFLLPGPIDSVVKYPTRQYLLAFPEVEAIAKRGFHNGEQYEQAVLRVLASVYFRWPRDERDAIGQYQLIKAFRTAPPPVSAELLRDFFSGVVGGTVREVISEMTWGEAIGNRKGIMAEVRDRLTADGTPFAEAAIRDLSVLVNEIRLPQALERTITLPQEEALKRLGVEQEAQAERAFIEAQGRAYQQLVDRGLFGALFTLFARRKTPRGQ